MSKWTKESAVLMIERNGGMVGGEKSINFSNPGIAVLGAIDYLVRLGYFWIKD